MPSSAFVLSLWVLQKPFQFYNCTILQCMNEWAVPSIFSIGSEEVYSVKSNRVGSVLNKLLQHFGEFVLDFDLLNGKVG